MIQSKKQEPVPDPNQKKKKKIDEEKKGGKQEEMGVWCCLIITYIVIKLVFLGVIPCIKAMGQRCTQNERRSTTFDLKNKKSPLWLKIGSTL